MRYYVYTLIDPRDSQFYVGGARTNRFQHMRSCLPILKGRGEGTHYSHIKDAGETSVNHQRLARRGA